VGTLDYLDARPRVGRDGGPVADDQAEVLTTVQEVLQDLVADAPAGVVMTIMRSPRGISGRSDY
jgi:hypothetical protein